MDQTVAKREKVLHSISFPRKLKDGSLLDSAYEKKMRANILRVERELGFPEGVLSREIMELVDRLSLNCWDGMLSLIKNQHECIDRLEKHLQTIAR